MSKREKKTLRIGVDTGGTFTDFISFDGDAGAKFIKCLPRPTRLIAPSSRGWMNF